MRPKERGSSAAYQRLPAGGEDGCAPKGYVPMLVVGEAGSERFLVHTRLLKHPSMAALLEMAAQEFGYSQQGVLTVPCEVSHFRRVIRVVSEAR